MFRTLTPIFSIIIAIAVYLLFTQGLFQDISSVQSETGDYKQAVNNAAQFNEKVASLKAKIDGFDNGEKDRLNALVPNSINEVKALVDLEQLIRAHGMYLANISVSPSQDNISQRPENSSKISFQEDFTSSDISFNLIGTYDQFRSLLKDVEKSLVLMEVTNISFSAAQSNSDLMQFGMTVRLYSLIPQNK